VRHAEIQSLIRQLAADPEARGRENLSHLGSEAFDPLCELLRDEDRMVRYIAASLLGSIGEPLAFEPLCEMLNDKDTMVRCAAIRTLGRIGGARAVEPLCEALGDQILGNRGSARTALLEIGDAVILPRKVLLEECLTPIQRFEALGALRRVVWRRVHLTIPLPEITAYCRELLQDQEEAIRQSAQAVLEAVRTAEQVETDDIPTLITRLGSYRTQGQALKALLRHGHLAVEPLCEALHEESWIVRQAAVEALGELRDTRAIEPLLQALGDRCRDVSWGATWALTKIGDTRAIEPLCQALQAENWVVQLHAVEALKRIGDARAVDPLCRLLADTWWEVRQAAAEALAELQDARAVEPLCRVFSHPDKGGMWTVLEAAANAIGKIGDARAVEPLCKALQDKDAQIREYAAVALKRMGNASTLPRKVLRETRLSPLQRLKALEALWQVNYWGDAHLWFPLPKITVYCRMKLLDWDKEVRQSARAVLEAIETIPP